MATGCRQSAKFSGLRSSFRCQTLRMVWFWKALVFGMYESFAVFIHNDRQSKQFCQGHFGNGCQRGQ